MRIRFDKYVIETCEDVYEPAEDSFALLDAIDMIKPSEGTFLDLGCGTGIVGIHVAKNYGLEVIFSDVNPKAVRCAKLNASLNNIRGSFVVGDSMYRLKEVDYVAFNPPYLPGEPEDEVDMARCGGPQGIREVMKFVNNLHKVRRGAFLLLTSFNPIYVVLEEIRSRGLHTRVLFTRSVAGEEYFLLYVYRDR